MSECIRQCQLCSKLVISNSITFTGGNLVVDLPERSYNNCEKNCIIFAQSIPTEATINAPVVFTIGGGETQYPFVNCNCTPIYASQVRTRRIYSTRVNTAVNSGVFKYIGKCCLPSNATTTVQSIPTEAAPAVTPTVVANTKATVK